LSYTTFAYTRTDETMIGKDGQRDTLRPSYDIAELAPSAITSDRNSDIAYFLTINNTGNVVSDVTALAFLAANTSNEMIQLMGGVTPPLSQLFDFTHVHSLAPGGSVTVFFQMSYRSLVHTDIHGHQWLLPGDYTIKINPEAEWTYSFTLFGAPTLVKAWPGSPLPSTSSSPKEDIRITTG